MIEPLDNSLSISTSIQPSSFFFNNSPAKRTFARKTLGSSCCQNMLRENFDRFKNLGFGAIIFGESICKLVPPLFLPNNTALILSRNTVPSPQQHNSYSQSNTTPSPQQHCSYSQSNTVGKLSIYVALSFSYLNAAFASIIS